MNCGEVNFIEELKKNLQDDMNKAIEEADKEMINNCKKLSHENMKRSEFDFVKAFQLQLEYAQFGKNIVEFGRKFRIEIRYAPYTEDQYELLKNDFERLYTNLNFEEEWKKVVEENR